jgi:copper chaperone CopZ
MSTTTTENRVGRRFHVTGMTCSHCEHAIETEIAGLPGVCAVTADATAGTVTVESTQELDVADVAAAVDEAGYELSR